MASESSGYYQLNMELLKRYHSNVWQAVTDTHLNPAGEVLETDTGEMNLKVDIKDKDPIFFHDRINPGRDGKDFLAIVPKNARGTVVFQGMGLGYGPVAVLENRKNIKYLVIFELCVEIFLQALRANDLSVLLSDPRVILSLGKDPDVNRVLSPAALAMRLEETSMLKHNPSCAYDKEGYETLGREIYNTANSLNISANTLKAYGTDFISNRLGVLKSIHHNSLIDSLRGRFKDIPAVMVAAGPSLNKDIHLIKSFKERAVIISADSALPALLAHNVTPDFVTSIDYKELTYEKIAACAPRAEGISLICSSWVAKKVARVFPADNIFWTFTGSAMEVWINEGLGGNIVCPGAGTVAHLNLVAAIVMGCSPIIFTGQDLSYSKKSGAQDHVSGTVLNSNDQTSMFFKNKDKILWVDGNQGGQVPASRPFLNYIDQFEKMISATPGTYINTTEEGAYIKGTQVMPLTDVLDKYCAKEHNISGILKASILEGRIGDITPFLGKIRSALKTVREMGTFIKKADRNSAIIKRELLKQNVNKKYQSFDSLPGKFQKKIRGIDKYHYKLDKEKWFWELFDEATMTALQETERMKHEIDKLENIPGKYIEWLMENLNRLDAVNREREKLLDSFEKELSEIVAFHTKEESLLKEIEKTGNMSREKLALLYCESGNFALAKPVLERSIEDDPKNSEICLNLGKIAAMHTEYDKADHFFSKALKMKPELKEKVDAFRILSGDEYMGYAAWYWKFDKESTKQMILKGLKLCPTHQKLNIEISTILTKEMKDVDSHLEEGNIEKFQEVMEKWIEIFHTHPELENHLPKNVIADYYKNCGKFFQISGDFLKAFETFFKAISCSNNNPEYYLLLSELMYEMDEENQAILYYEKAVQMDNEFVKKYEKNKEQAKNGIPADDSLNFNLLGDEHFLNNRFDDAIDCYEKALSVDKENPDILHKLGVALKESGKIEQAVGILKKVIAMDPDNYNAYYNLGVALQSSAKIDEAIDAYEKAIELKPDFLNALNNLGNAYNSNKVYSKAIMYYEKILELNPNYADALNNLGVVFQAMGRYDNAITCYKKYLEMNPGNAVVANNLQRLADR